jgi:hypothetical protein
MEAPIVADDVEDGEEIDNDDDDESSEADGMDNSSGSEDDLDDLGEDNDEVIDDELVDKFIRTFHNGDYDAEFDVALSVDRSVSVPNGRPTQASYNKPDNWVERNRIGLEKMKRQLQNFINLVTEDQSSKVRLYLTHNDRWFQLGDNEEPIVWHDEILDEYWDRMKARLDGRKQLEIYTDIKDIEIENVEITKDRIATLVTALSGHVNTTEYIQFNNVNLCEEGIGQLSKLVDVSSNLKEFCLHHNRIDNMESARCLSRSLKLHTRINYLDLAHCNLGSSPEILSVILQSDVKQINLNSNNIDSLGVVKIAEYLESNPAVEYMSLTNNRLNDDDAILISQALKRNTNLKAIDLRSNNITSIGMKALLKCVYDSSSLNAISESNHTLACIHMFSKGVTELVGCINEMLQLERIEKILFALQDKESLLKYLANIPMELIPNVLALPLQRAGIHCQCRNLNIVYTTMRWWNMPMLYSYHNSVKSDTKRKRDK